MAAKANIALDFNWWVVLGVIALFVILILGFDWDNLVGKE